MLAQYKNPKYLNKIRDALRMTDGNKTRAAKLLNLSRGQFYRALETLGWDAKVDGRVAGNDGTWATVDTVAINPVTGEGEYL